MTQVLVGECTGFWGLGSRTFQGFPGISTRLQDVGLTVGEDGVDLVEHQFHDLTLENHVDRHVGRLRLWAEQRGSKHDGDTLHRHPVGVLVLDHPGQIIVIVIVCVRLKVRGHSPV